MAKAEDHIAEGHPRAARPEGGREAPALGAGRALPGGAPGRGIRLAGRINHYHPRESGDLGVSGHEVPAFAGMTEGSRG